MKMTDEIRDTRENFLHRRNNSNSHVVNQSDGVPILLLDTSKKWDKQFLPLRRYFNAAQHDLRDPIYSAE
jgi:hypothetical protein